MDGLDKLFDEIATARRRQLPILKAAPTDCNGCGACCTRFVAVDVKETDPNFAWLDNHDLVAYGAFGPSMKIAPGEQRRCAALVGTVGVDAQCSIYDHRPQVCRAFIPGDTQCRDSIIVQIQRKRCEQI
jgi:uncharacterized protein